MTKLYIIRHGQASFGAENYDKLSPLGEQQATVTGRYLHDLGLAFDHAIAGDLSRQQVTARNALAAWRDAPALETRPEFNEYRADKLFEAYLEQVLGEKPEWAARRAEMYQDSRLFQRIFERVTHKWLEDADHDAEPFEGWAAFRSRVAEGLNRIRSGYDRHSRIALFTSGGPISVCVGECLNLQPESIVQLNWVVYNCSLTELHSSRDGWRLMGYNNVSHLQLEKKPELITLR